MTAVRSRSFLRRALGLSVIVVVVAIPAVVLASAGAPRLPTLAGCRVLPASNPWNQRVDNLPPPADSSRILGRIGLSARVHPDFGTTYAGAPNGIPITIATRHTRRLRVRFQYASESDRSRYPLPRRVAIEGGPRSTGDRHVIVLDRSTCTDYELYDARPHGSCSPPARHPASPNRVAHESSCDWTAGSGAIFPLGSNHLRPAGWTSADAAGLPILPGLARYSEVAAGAVDHALRFTSPCTGPRYVYPARHLAPSCSGAFAPPMGLRVRLKASVSISGLPYQARVIAVALKRYGLILADNGSPWYISGAPDRRWSDSALHELGRLSGGDFQVVNTASLPHPGR
ncbi:MAG: hypothetical protein ABI339_02195 [Solirubrobacteraceae bacterium]